MVRICCIKNCRSSNVKNPGLSFFSIPTVITYQCDKTKALSAERRRTWLKITGLTEDTLKDHHKVCSKHFISGHASKLFENTHPDWIPHLNLECDPSVSKCRKTKKDNAAARFERHERRIKRAKLTYNTKSNGPKNDLSNTNFMESGRSASPENIVIKVEPPDFFDDANENSDFSNDALPDFEVHELVMDGNTIIETKLSNLSVFLNGDGEMITSNIGDSFEVRNVESNISDIFEKQNVESNIEDTLEVQAQLLIDGSTQTEHSGLTIFENTGPGKLRQTEAKVVTLVDNSAQTSFRVCYKFELEAASLEIQELKLKIEELNQNMKEAYDEIRTLRERKL